jgi:hypothetical protein
MELRKRMYLEEAMSVSVARRVAQKHAKMPLIKKVFKDLGLKGGIDDVVEKNLPDYLMVVFCALAAKKGVELSSSLKSLCLKNAKEILNSVREAGEVEEEE